MLGAGRPMDLTTPVLALALAVFVAGLVVGAWLASLLLGLRHAATADRTARAVRREAVEGSRRVIRGQVSEQLAPYLGDFEFDPAGARFIGSPVDFVVFDGLADGELRSVVLVEVKTGAARLNERQRRIRDVIEAGEVDLAWRELRLPGE